MRNRNIFLSLGLLAFCLYSWFEIKNLPTISSFFPKVCIFFLVLLSLLLLIQSWFSKDIIAEEKKKNIRYVKILTAGIAGYVGAIFFIGFNLGSILFLSLFSYIFNPTQTKKSLLKACAFALFTTTIFYVVFGLIFNVPLPAGLLIEKLT